MSEKSYDHMKIAEFNYWDLFLHESQYYLGRSYLSAKKEGDRNIFEMSSHERQEFFEVGEIVDGILIDLFQRDKLNAVQLGNEYHHLHVHLIPRYQTPRVFDGIGFEDAQWGKNYAPYDKTFRIPEPTLFKIRDAIKERL